MAVFFFVNNSLVFFFVNGRKPFQSSYFYYMKNCVLVIMLLFYGVVNGQVSMQINLPATVQVNHPYVYELKIKKGKLTDFSKYQAHVPQGVVFTEVDSRGGSFSFSENRLKIVWALTPAEEELSVKLSVTFPDTGKITINHKYLFLRNGEKAETEMEPIEIHAVNNEPASTVPVTFRLVRSRLPSESTHVMDADSIGAAGPDELALQVAQLKKDSRDAFQVGNLEKEKALARLDAAMKTLAETEKMPAGPEKETAVNRAMEEKGKADGDVEVASRILLLAKTLEQNAAEIERVSGLNATDSTVALPSTGTGGIVVDIDAPDPEIISYRLQLGAFGKRPALSQYSRLENVTVENENGVYKVMMGNFTSKSEALRKREQLLKMGLDGFVVAFKNGARIR